MGVKIVPGALNFQLIPGYAALEKALRQKSRATHLCLLEVGCWQLPELSSVGGLLQGHLGGGVQKASAPGLYCYDETKSQRYNLLLSPM